MFPYPYISIPAPRLESDFRIKIALSAQTAAVAAGSSGSDRDRNRFKRYTTYTGGTWSGHFGYGTVVVSIDPHMVYLQRNMICPQAQTQTILMLTAFFFVLTFSLTPLEWRTGDTRPRTRRDVGDADRGDPAPEDRGQAAGVVSSSVLSSSHFLLPTYPLLFVHICVYNVTTLTERINHKHRLQSARLGDREGGACGSLEEQRHSGAGRPPTI